MKGNEKILVGVGVTLLVLLLAFVIFLILRRRKRTKYEEKCSKTIRNHDGHHEKKEISLEEMVELYTIKTDMSAPYEISKLHGIGKRNSQQDCFGVSDTINTETLVKKGVLLVLADGMGGLQRGEEVSTQLTVFILNAFEELEKSPIETEDLLQIARNANDFINRLLGEEWIGKCGATLVLLHVLDNQARWVTIGDSCIYYFHNGRLSPLNVKHNYMMELRKKVDQEIISIEEAEADKQKDALISFVGIGDLELIDFSKIPLELCSGDRLLLMSDGIFGTISDTEIHELMANNIQEVSYKMEELILHKNIRNQDNYTAIILGYK